MEQLEKIIKKTTDRQQSETGSNPKNRSTGSGSEINWRDVLKDQCQEKAFPVKGSRCYQESYYQGHNSERSGPGTSGITRREEQSVPKNYLDDDGEKDMRHTDRSSKSTPEDAQRRFLSNNRTNASKNYLENGQDKDVRLPRGRYYDYDKSSGSGNTKTSRRFRSDKLSIPKDNQSGKPSTSPERKAPKPMTFATSWEEDQYIRGLPTDGFFSDPEMYNSVFSKKEVLSTG